MLTSRKRCRRRRGFTLIEVMLVLVILMILGTLTGVAVIRQQETAFVRAATAQIRMFKTPLGSYRLDVGSFPTTAQGLEALREAPSDLANPDKWRGKYLEEAVPMDPWDNEYQYEYPGSSDEDSPDIWSWGPDGVDGPDDDISNREEE